MNFSKLEDGARKLAGNAKDGSMKDGKNIFRFIFDHKEWCYAVFKNDEVDAMLSFNTKKLATAKTWMREWLAN